MRIGIFLSTLGGSPLQGGMERGLAELGHDVEDYRPGGSYDLIVAFNQCAHATNYEYLTFPPKEIPVAFIDTAEYGYFKRLPGVIQEYWNAFAPGSINHDTKNKWQQDRLFHWLEGRSFPYFLREHSLYLDLPGCYHPIDYPLYYKSVCEERPDREEYLRRSKDIFLSWGASHPWRWNITRELRSAPVTGEILVLEENGTPRMPQFGPDGYFERIRGAKCSVSFDGYGSGSFRMTEVLCRTLLLQGPLTIRMRAPLVNGETCMAYDVGSEGEEFLWSNISPVLQMAMHYPERSFEIYRNGFEHCMEHLTEAATARYVLDVVERHDWGKPTLLTR